MGAVSQITYVPAGWVEPAGYDEVDNEILVLEGDLYIGNGPHAEKLTKYSYSYIPAGVVRGPLRSKEGAVLLQWLKGPLTFVRSSTDKPGARSYARVRDSNHLKSPWYVGKPFPDYRTGGNFPGAIHKLLRQDPDSGEMTWMTFRRAFQPRRTAGQAILAAATKSIPVLRNIIFPRRATTRSLGNASTRARPLSPTATTPIGGDPEALRMAARSAEPRTRQPTRSQLSAPEPDCGRPTSVTAATKPGLNIGEPLAGEDMITTCRAIDLANDV
jgi:hypothetical protein